MMNTTAANKCQNYSLGWRGRGLKISFEKCVLCEIWKCDKLSQQMWLARDDLSIIHSYSFSFSSPDKTKTQQKEMQRKEDGIERESERKREKVKARLLESDSL